MSGQVWDGFASGATDLSRRTVLGGAMTAPALITGCASPSRLSAVPQPLTLKAEPEIANVRYLVIRDLAPLRAEGLRAVERERADLAKKGGGELPDMAMLAISGGGDDGAFGAGLLNGWTAHGDRPEFKVVTGISTGALSAPFAFLGPRYDPQLKTVYTEVSQKDIFSPRNIVSAVMSDAMADSTPLHKTVGRYIDRALLDAIAAEYARGRLLLVGTTNLDTLEPVMWNMTAIAASGDPKAAELFRKVLVASASIPGAFPPVLIDVTAGGQRYQEMHVDGGAVTQVFAYPPGFVLKNNPDLPWRRRRLYIIRNARLDPDWASTRRRTLPIAARAITSLTQTQGVGDLYRIYLVTQRDGVDFNLAAIPPSFNHPRPKPFDQDYMRALFDVGRQMGAQGFPWADTPPGYVEAAQ